MHQQREHVIFRLKSAHVILKTARVYRSTPAAQHLHDVTPQPVKIHIHIDFQRIVYLGGSPIIGKSMAEHRLHHRLRVIDMLKVFKHISVIPTARFIKVHVIPHAQFFYFILGKPGVLFQRLLIRHGIFREHIQGRVFPVLLNRQNPCHVRKRDIRLVF